MEDLNELKERVSALELHRQYDIKMNKEQTEKLDEALSKIDEIYIGLRWVIRVGKFLTAAAALAATCIAIIKGVGK